MKITKRPYINTKGFTLVEIMIVVAIIGLLAAIAVPSFIRARLRSQATTVLNECRLLDAAKDQYALENNKAGSITPGFADLTPYLKVGSNLAVTSKDTLGGSFAIGDITTKLRVSSTTKTTVSEATGGDTFWGGYS
jgi:prepilin-type N-terminal cleavage/methylation domain-containing protein